MSDIATRLFVSVLVERAFATAYQQLAAQALENEKLTDEDLLLIEFETLSAIRLDESAWLDASIETKGALQDAKDKIHNSFSAYRRARRLNGRTQNGFSAE